jgi:hypothetical protein
LPRLAPVTALHHRRNDFLTNLATNPTWTCIGAHTTTGAYNEFVGNPKRSTDVSTFAGFYTTTAVTKYAWYNQAACTTAYAAMCEIPR